MKKNDKINLDSVSNINEKIIDEVTDKKISLLQKLGGTTKNLRKRLIAIGSIAASFILMFSVLLVIIIPMLGSDVPVYQGMTIRQESSSSMKVQDYGFHDNGITLLSASRGNNGFVFLSNSNGNGNAYGHDKDNHKDKEDKLEKNIEDMVTIDVVTDGEVRYYVKPGETFIIEIHIDNPRDYEIQSFTLNGQKYANYMFKDGSTMELLLLEVTAPTTPGFFEYTIDAIKYIDGTEIKDVDMSSGDKSIKIGVTYTSALSAMISDVAVGPTDFSFSVNISDKQALILDNPITAYLSDGESIVASQALTLGENQVAFHTLIRGKTYEYGILTYDYVDGKGMQARWLHTAYFTTKAPYVSVENVSARGNEIAFDILINDENNVTSIDKIELYNGNTLLQVADNPSVRTFAETVTSSNYIIKVSYSYDLGNGSKKAEIAEGYPEYSITYHTNGGQLDDAVSTFTWSDLPLKLNYPTQSGTVFDGWYSDAAATLLLKNSEITSVGDVVVYARWAEATDGLTFEISSDHVTVTGYSGSDTEVLIPERYLGLPVTEIGEYAFHDKDHVVSVTMGDSIKIIKDYAFMNMDNLKQITIGSRVTSIGQYAFNACRQLTSLVIPDSVVNIGQGAFSENDRLMFVTIGSSVTNIGPDAFKNCSKLFEVYNRSQLTIKAGQTNHGGVAKYALNVYTPAAGKQQILIDNDGYVFHCTEVECVLLEYVGTAKELSLPSTCKDGKIYSIREKAFSGRADITSIVVPEGITTISGLPAYTDSPFYNCKGLTTVTLPSTLTQFGGFQGCYNLKTVIFNGTVEQWLELTRGWDYYYETANYVVQCTNGVV